MSLKKYIIILTASLTALAAAFILYAADSFRMYTDNKLDNYMANFINDLKDPDKDIAISNAADMKKSNFDKADASIRKGLAYLAQKDSLTFKLQSTPAATASTAGTSPSPVFDIYDGNDPLLRVTLNAKDHASRLNLLSFYVWEIKDVKLLRTNGLFDYEISLPNSYTVEVNGNKLTEKDSPDSLLFTGLADIAKKTPVSYQVNYILKGLTDAPEVKVTDKNGKTVDLQNQSQSQGQSQRGLFIPLECVKAADEASAKPHIKNYPDILHIVHEWSLYMSHDQHGGRNGFDNIEQYLIPGTYLHNYSLRWSKSVDITYVSSHGLDKPIFSNEKVCNFEIYSDKEFSCDVFMQKNLIVAGKLADKLAERIHFLYYDDTDDGKDNPTWKILGMMSLPR